MASRSDTSDTSGTAAKAARSRPAVDAAVSARTGAPVARPALRMEQDLAQLAEVMAHLPRDEAGGKAPRRAKPSSPPATGEAPGPDRDELLHALKVFRRVSQELATWEPVLIGATRGRGGTWTEIAQALGLASRQAAERRFLRLNPDVGDRPGTTREQRVQTARDRRSGDRAVAAWARQNAAQLRELAGQISVLPARAQGGRAGREAIHAALGDDDAAALLGPLSAAAPYLQRGHHDLAEQVRAVDRKTARIRSADQDRRSPTRPGRTDAAE